LLSTFDPKICLLKQLQTLCAIPNCWQESGHQPARSQDEESAEFRDPQYAVLVCSFSHLRLIVILAVVNIRAIVTIHL
jgi:hypothetical protein